MARPTLKDVAAQAGVSYQTVSKVLNQQGNVTPETEARIWQAVETLNYTPNVSARNLRTQSSNLIGYAWQRTMDDAPRPVLDQFLYEAVLHFEQHGYHLLTFLVGLESDAGHSIYRTLYDRQQVEGFILADTNNNDPRIAFLMSANIPFTAFGRANDDWDFCWVDVDGRLGMREVIRHLQEQGHTRVGLITWPEGSRAGEERESGYTHQMAEAGLPVAPEWVARGENTVHHGYHLMQQLLALPAAERPTAVACVSDQIAIGAMNAALANGLVIGQDVAITGYDNAPMSEFLYPPLTTVQQPIQEVSEQVVNLLLKQINQEPIPQKGILLEPKLIIRESS
jgi:DNA-binding LacI/PurR family transcriptional regulator